MAPSKLIKWVGKPSKARRRLEQRRPFRRRMLEVMDRSDAGEISEATSMDMINSIVNEMNAARDIPPPEMEEESGPEALDQSLPMEVLYFKLQYQFLNILYYRFGAMLKGRINSTVLCTDVHRRQVNTKRGGLDRLIMRKRRWTLSSE